MGSVAIFGDVGGHAEEFYAQLVALGADPDTLTLPDGLTVIQVGDLIHRGPASRGALNIAETLLDNRHGTSGPSGVPNYVQLSGNHEGQYLHKPRFAWHEELYPEDADRLRAWFADGRMKVAAGIRTAAGEQLLITHAGLTRGLWRKLGSPASVERAVAAVNKLIPNDPKLARAGTMLEGAVDDTAGPWWAEAGTELYTPWAQASARGEKLPFSQIHGHSTVYWWKGNRYNFQYPKPLQAATRLDHRSRHVELSLPGGRLIGIDPGHTTAPARRWSALLIPDATLVAH